MTVSYESNPRTLDDWIGMIARGKLQLPRFQRLEAWGPSDVEELLRSVLRGLPVGAALVLQVSGKPEFAARPLETAPDGPGPIEEMLLDGQQRLTALWRSLTENYDTDLFFVRHADDEDDDEESPTVVRERIREKDGKIYPLWTQDPRRTYERNLIPVRLLHPKNEAMASKWVDEVAGDDLETYKTLTSRVTGLRERVKHFQIPYIRLGAETSPEAIITVFTKTNTQGAQLSAFDLVVARMELRGIDLHQKSNELREQVTGLERFSRFDDLDMLRALVLLEGRQPTRKNLLEIKPETIAGRWDDVILGAIEALEFLAAEGIFDDDRIPTTTVLPVLFALWAEVGEGIPQGNARRLFRQYIWHAFFSNRYESSSSSSVLQDFRALRACLAGEWEGELPFVKLGELPTSPAILKEVGWPTRRDRLARAILCTTLRNGAKDIYSAADASPTNIAAREYHHAFPRKFLSDHFPDSDQDLALNAMLITRKANRTVSAAPPKKYLEATAEKVLGEGELEARLRSHIVPPEPFLTNDYPRFLDERAKLVFDAMTQLTKGEDWKS